MSRNHLLEYAEYLSEVIRHLELRGDDASFHRKELEQVREELK